MPRELIAPAPNQVAFREVASQPLGPTQLRVHSRFAAAKHGTEMALYKGYANPRGAYDKEYRIFRAENAGVNYPVRLGNICVGEIVEIGAAVTGFSLGERVFRYGSFCDEHVWQADSVRRLPDTVPWQAAMCLDPAHFAVGALRDGHVRIGDAVAIFGLGAIGLIAVQFARLAGAYPVIAVDPIALRREVAAECGADLVLDPNACDAGLEIKRATQKRGRTCASSTAAAITRSRLRCAAWRTTAWWWRARGPARTLRVSIWARRRISTVRASSSRAR